jgi:hypothetical protein
LEVQAAGWISEGKAGFFFSSSWISVLEKVIREELVFPPFLLYETRLEFARFSLVPRALICALFVPDFVRASGIGSHRLIGHPFLRAVLVKFVC